MKEMHSLLNRQIRKSFGDRFPPHKEWQAFLRAIDDAYKEFDSDRAMLERTLELSSKEHINTMAQLLKVRELSIGIEYKKTLDDVCTFIVDSAGEIPGIRFAVIHRLDESGKLIVPPQYSKINDEGLSKLLNVKGFIVDSHSGKDSGDGELRYELAKELMFQEYARNPRTLVIRRLSETLGGVWTKTQCDSVQKILGIKKIVVTPVIIEGKLWGTLVYLLDRHISQDILETISTHCTLGIKNVLTLEELSNSEKKVRYTIEAVTEGIISFDLEGRIIDINKAGLKLYGCTNKRELIGENISKLFRQEKELVYFRNLLKTKKTGGIRNIPYNLVREDGKIFDVEINTAIIQDKDGNAKGFVTSIRDVTERKRAEKELQESHARFMELADMLPMSVFELDVKGQAVYFNKEALRAWNSTIPTKQDAIKGNPLESFVPEDRERIAKYVTSILTGEHVGPQEYTALRDDGTIFPIVVYAAPVIKDNKIVGVRGAAADITERKRAEEKIQASEQRLKEAQSLGKIGSYEFDIINESIIWSDGLYELLERDKTLPPPTTEGLLSYLSPEDLQKYIEFSRNIGQGVKQVSHQINLEFKLPSGNMALHQISVHPIKDNKGRVVKLFGIVQDITEIRRAEMQIREQKELIDRILNTMKATVLVLDNELNIVLSNRFAYEMLRQNPEEMIGKSVYNIFASDELLRAISAVKSNGNDDINHEIQYTLDTGARVFLSNIIRMEQQELLIIITDITEENERRDRLYLTDRLASIGEMAAGVAHELNNPLTGIIGLAELLLNTGKDYTEENKEDLRLISVEAQRAADVVKNLLTFARRHEPTAQPVEVNSIIENVIKLRAYEHRVNNIEVITMFNNNLPKVMADQFQLQQVFLNLVLNAEQAIMDAKKGGKITITTENTKEGIKLSFADNGPGIASENIRKIFTPFFTTKEVGKGTGLGLSICYGIVSNHGGKIYAQSKASKGATFIIELPLNNNRQ
ncbi:MAG: PAS domain S-box protein [Dehalococcoidales bacterium]|nr:PAS domain S-box protein [Dehalococcoidales bacterium]